MRFTLEQVQEMFHKRGSTLLSKEYINSSQKLVFTCAKCGAEITSSLRAVDFKKDDPILCRKCRGVAKPDLEDIRKIVEQSGAKLLSTEYVNAHAPLRFLCSRCGSEHQISWTHITCGRNKDFLCDKCSSSPFYKRESFDDIKQYFADRKVKLLSTEYINRKDTKLEFECTRCGKSGFITWEKIKDRGQNKEFLCKDCLRGNTFNPAGAYGDSRRNLVDAFWLKKLLEFYNVGEGYSAHHIIPFKYDPKLRTSFANGFPIPRNIHNSAFVDENGVKDPFHSIPEYMDPSNWPLHYRLNYQNYAGFEYHNLNSVLQTEILCTNIEYEVFDLYNKKKTLAEEGIFYIPIYFEEIFIDRKKEIVFSMIRNRLWKTYPDIFDYTGQTHRIFYARKLEVHICQSSELKDFYNNNHIQGYIPGNFCVCLTFNNEIVAAMSFGKPRSATKYQYELLRYAVAKNTFIHGAAQKLFKFFLKEADPQSIISYCDIRFSSLDPNETFYPKLGFRYDGYSRPNYRYSDPLTNRIFSRQSYQKHKLSDKLENFNPELSEIENMRANGFFRQYDCGNHRFVWLRR